VTWWQPSSRWLGILSFVLAGVLWYRERRSPWNRARAAKEKKNGELWTQRKLGSGSPWVAFGAGIVLNLPGIWVL
jgi:hypothetical protein